MEYEIKATNQSYVFVLSCHVFFLSCPFMFCLSFPFMNCFVMFCLILLCQFPVLCVPFCHSFLFVYFDYLDTLKWFMKICYYIISILL